MLLLKATLCKVLPALRTCKARLSIWPSCGCGRGGQPHHRAAYTGRQPLVGKQLASAKSAAALEANETLLLHLSCVASGSRPAGSARISARRFRRSLAVQALLVDSSSLPSWPRKRQVHVWGRCGLQPGLLRAGS